MSPTILRALLEMQRPALLMGDDGKWTGRVLQWRPSRSYDTYRMLKRVAPWPVDLMSHTVYRREDWI